MKKVFFCLGTGHCANKRNQEGISNLRSLYWLSAIGAQKKRRVRGSKEGERQANGYAVVGMTLWPYPRAILFTKLLSDSIVDNL